MRAHLSAGSTRSCAPTAAIAASTSLTPAVATSHASRLQRLRRLLAPTATASLKLAERRHRPASRTPAIPTSCPRRAPGCASSQPFTIGSDGRRGPEVAGHRRAIGGRPGAVFVVAVPAAQRGPHRRAARRSSSCSSGSPCSSACAAGRLVCRAPRLPSAAPDRGHRRRHRRRRPHPAHPDPHRQGRGRPRCRGRST